ncbi:MAG: MBG domain-containing protein [Acidimicrobiia bacterium]
MKAFLERGSPVRRFSLSSRHPHVRQCLLVALTLVVTILGTLPVSAALWTDKIDYPPGEVVTITGDGMDAGETVAVDVYLPDGTHDHHAEVIADEAGGFIDTYQLPPASDPVVGTYTVVAVGLSSGHTFTMTFEDGPKVDVWDATCNNKITAAVNAGTTVCGKATGLGNEAAGRIVWIRPDGSVARSTSYSGVNGNTSDTFAPDACGTWSLRLTSASGTSDLDSTTFDVVNCQTSVTITADNKGIDYGQATPAFTFQSAPALPAADAATVTCSVGSPVPTHAGSYTISCSGLDPARYDATYVAGTFTIGKKQLTVTAPGPTIGYGQAVPALTPTIAGFVPGETVSVLDTAPDCTAGSPAPVHAGSYVVSCSGGSDGDYSFGYSAGTLTINEAALSITADNKTIEYGEAIPDFSVTPNGFQYSDDLSDLSGTLACAASPSPATPPAAGSYTISCSGLSSDDYTISYLTGLLTVTRAQVSVTAGNQSITYGDSLPAFTFTTTGSIQPADAAGITCGVPSGTGNAATVAISCSGLNPANYDVDYVNGTLTISKKQLAVTALSGSKPYDGVSVSVSRTITGFVNAETEGVLDTPPSCSSDPSPILNAGSYDTSCSGGDDGNYAFSYTPGSYTVNQAPLSITAGDFNKVYGAALPSDLTAGVEYSGFVAGEDESDLTGTLSCDTTATQSSVVATYPVTCSGIGSTNYDITYHAGVLTVTKAPLAVAAFSGQKTYDGAVVPVTATITGFVLGENAAVIATQPACTSDPTPIKNARTYATSCSGGSDANYEFSYTPGSYTVDEAKLRVTGGTFDKQYSDPMPGDLTAGVSFVGFVGSESASDLGGTPTCTTEATVLSDIGRYPVTCGGFSSTNYTITYMTGTFNVTGEDARATYTGPTFALAPSTSSASATVALSATVKDISAVDPALSPPNPDSFPGDIRTGTLTFVNRDAADAVLCSAPIGLVSTADQTVGVGTCNAVLPVGTTGSTQYTIGIVIGGNYSGGDSGENVVVTVALPIATNFVTGGGYLLNGANSAGVYAGTAGSKTNFGFNAKFNKGGSNLQGNVNIIVRSSGRVIQFKGNSPTSISVDVKNGKAVLQAKANVQDITVPTAPVSIDGNASLTLTMTDKGEPGTADSVGLQVLSKSGGLYFSSQWNGTRTTEKVLGGGNLVVH